MGRSKQQIGRSSKQKGARGERQSAKRWSQAGFPTHRGRQYHGGSGTSDVKHEQSFLNFRTEVKLRKRNVSIYKAIEQAEEESVANEVPLVHHKVDNRRWLMTMYDEDFFKLLRLAHHDEPELIHALASIALGHELFDA